MKRWGAILATTIAAIGVASAACASPFDGLIVFGDSLSDVGNISQATSGVFPGPYYYNGRFSNGPVYAETLTTGLGLAALSPSTAGGNDFAYGGAQTSGTGGLDGAFIKDLDEQVDEFVSTRAADPKSLFEVFSGANDLINGQTSVNAPVATITAQIGRLVTAGATQFFVPNLPLLGDTPRFNGNVATQLQYNTLTTQFNTALSAALDNLQSENSALTFFRFDVAGLFQDLRSNPSAYGFTNVTNSAAPGLTSGTLLYNKNKIVPNPNQYVFWDDLHPTTSVHAIFAQRALALLSLPGDFNHDGLVDAADYTVWRDEFGLSGPGLAADGDGNKIVDSNDFKIWKADFGQTATNGGTAGTLIDAPEPKCIVLVGELSSLILVISRLTANPQGGRVSRGFTWLVIGPRRFPAPCPKN
jgi:phospholipase/lecithinase/hemolysin